MKLYIIQAAQYFKVGISINPRSRIKEMQTGNPVKLKLRCVRDFKGRGSARKAEAKAHKMLSEFNTQCEWFDASFEQIKSVIDSIYQDSCTGRLYAKQPREWDGRHESLEQIRQSPLTTVIISKRNIRYVMTGGVGIGKASVKMLGLSYPLKGGWIKKCIGMEVSKARFLELAEIARTK